MGSEAILELIKIGKVYNNEVALKDVDLFLNKGEILAILGKNGSGKSTLIKVISGAIRADYGDIFVEGRHVKINNPEDAINLGIQTIYQELQLFENLSVAENILFRNSLITNRRKYLQIINWKSLYRSAQELCNKYGYNLDVRKKVKELGMGDRQIVSIIKILSKKPKIMIMDEPTSSLTDADRKILFQTMKRVKKAGISILFITHNIDDIYRIADRVAIIREGEIIKNQLVTQTEGKDILKSMAGNSMNQRYPKLFAQKKDELIRVENLSKPGSIDNISFLLRKGEIVGIAGLNGSGRTSLLKTLFGANGKYKGSIFIKGKDVNIKSPKDAVKNGIAFIPEDRSLAVIPQLNIVKNASIAHLRGMEHTSVRFLVNKKFEQTRVVTYLKRMAIKFLSIHQKMHSISGGNQQKVLISRWIFSMCDILLFDEPTKGIDIANKVEIFNIMNELVRNGKGILFISSDLSEIVGMCDRVLVMRNGKIVKELKSKMASKEQILYYASGGE